MIPMKRQKKALVQKELGGWPSQFSLMQSIHEQSHDWTGTFEKLQAFTGVLYKGYDYFLEALRKRELEIVSVDGERLIVRATEDFFEKIQKTGLYLAESIETEDEPAPPKEAKNDVGDALVEQEKDNVVLLFKQ